jgi:hypothetical protein
MHTQSTQRNSTPKLLGIGQPMLMSTQSDRCCCEHIVGTTVTTLQPANQPTTQRTSQKAGAETHMKDNEQPSEGLSNRHEGAAANRRMPHTTTANDTPELWCCCTTRQNTPANAKTKDPCRAYEEERSTGRRDRTKVPACAHAVCYTHKSCTALYKQTKGQEPGT